MSEFTIKTTKPEDDRTRASVVDYKKTGKKNIVMKGPLSEIISKTLHELFKFDDRKTNAPSVESTDILTLSSNGRQIIVDKAGEGQVYIYVVVKSKSTTDDLLNFNKLIKDKEFSDDVVFISIVDKEGSPANPWTLIIEEIAKLNNLAVYNDLDSFFSKIFDEEKEEPDMLTQESDEVESSQEEDSVDSDEMDLSVEALDNYKPVKKKTVKSVSTVKDLKKLSKEANTAISEIEALVDKVKKQTVVYQTWSINAAEQLAEANPEDYEKLSQQLSKTRPQSPAELVSEYQFNWPNGEITRITTKNEKTQEETVFSNSDIEQEETEVEVTEPDEETVNLIQTSRNKINELIEDVKQFASNGDKTPELDKTIEEINKKSKEGSLSKEIKFHTHPKAVFNTTVSFAKGAVNALTAWGKVLGLVLFS
ncbi:MAG: hypothetical protein M0R77_00780 [Gammaproteobacteria bacterium]|nr:hypothetical protein [Acholeplasmataceae bacterium]MCK9529089.1 hypothetical protein [Gammaproteobacteria bacterium]